MDASRTNTAEGTSGRYQSYNPAFPVQQDYPMLSAATSGAGPSGVSVVSGTQGLTTTAPNVTLQMHHQHGPTARRTVDLREMDASRTNTAEGTSGRYQSYNPVVPVRQEYPMLSAATSGAGPSGVSVPGIQGITTTAPNVTLQMHHQHGPTARRTVSAIPRATQVSRAIRTSTRRTAKESGSEPQPSSSRMVTSEPRSDLRYSGRVDPAQPPYRNFQFDVNEATLNLRSFERDRNLPRPIPAIYESGTQGWSAARPYVVEFHRQPEPAHRTNHRTIAPYRQHVHRYPDYPLMDDWTRYHTRQVPGYPRHRRREHSHRHCQRISCDCCLYDSAEDVLVDGQYRRAPHEQATYEPYRHQISSITYSLPPPPYPGHGTPSEVFVLPPSSQPVDLTRNARPNIREASAELQDNAHHHAVIIHQMIAADQMRNFREPLMQLQHIYNPNHRSTVQLPTILQSYLENTPQAAQPEQPAEPQPLVVDDTIEDNGDSRSSTPRLEIDL